MYCAGTPRLLRCDLGTENSRLAFIQPFLRRNDGDSFAGSSSFRYGKSTANQVQHYSTRCIKLYQHSFSMENMELNVKGV